MMVKQILTLLLILFSSVTVVGQQQGIYSNFLLNENYYNPAIAGSKNVHIVSLGYRNQWTGFTGAPVNVNANFYGSVKNKGKHGYGISFINEKMGITNKAGLYLNYAYHIKLSQRLKLGFGIRPGYIQYGVKLYDAQLADQGDEILTGNIYSAGALDVNTGFHLYSSKFFVMGSLNHLLGKSVQFTTYNSSLSFHYNLIGGYNFNLVKQKVVLQPSIMLKYASPVPVQWTGMVKATYSDKYWLGLIYRSEDAVGISAGLMINERFNVGYGFDYTIAGLRKQQSGSHEIMLSFVITKKRPTLEEEDDELNKSIMDNFQKMNEEDPSQPTPEKTEP